MKLKSKLLTQKNRLKKAVFLKKVVRVTGFEPAASCSQSRRATNCATPGYLIFLRFIVAPKRFLQIGPATFLQYSIIYESKFFKPYSGAQCESMKRRRTLHWLGLPPSPHKKVRINPDCGHKRLDGEEITWYTETLPYMGNPLQLPFHATASIAGSRARRKREEQTKNNVAVRIRTAGNRGFGRNDGERAEKRRKPAA